MATNKDKLHVDVDVRKTVRVLTPTGELELDWSDNGQQWWIVSSDTEGNITLPPEIDTYPGARYLRQDFPNGTIELTPVALLSSQF